MVALALSPKSRQALLDIGDASLAYTGREELAPGLRMAPVGRYVVFFRMLGDLVRIERVLNGARDLPNIFGQAPTA